MAGVTQCIYGNRRLDDNIALLVTLIGLTAKNPSLLSQDILAGVPLHAICAALFKKHQQGTICRRVAAIRNQVIRNQVNG